MIEISSSATLEMGQFGQWGAHCEIDTRTHA